MSDMPILELSNDLIKQSIEVQTFIHAYVQGYRGFVPLNTCRELDTLIREAKELKEKMMELRPHGFKRYFK